jgi:hypothetical protein
MKQIFVNKENNYIKSINCAIPNYEEYTTKSFKYIPNFRLSPSLIKPSFLSLTNKTSLKICDHYEYVYSMELEKQNFKTCYLNFDIKKKEVLNKKTILQKNKNYENMTIVTGFLDLHIDRKHKRESQVYSYIEKSYPTLSIQQNMVIYVSKELVEHVTDIRTKLNLIDKTKIIIITKDNLFMENNNETLQRVFLKTKQNIIPYDNDYLILLVNTRYNYVLDSISNNYFNTDYFAWVDFGAGHIVNIPQQTKIEYSNSSKVRMAWIARFEENKFAFNHCVLGGGLFCGHKEIIKEFIKLHNQEFLNILDMGYVINDDKLLFFVFEKYPYLFDTFFSGYKSIASKM